MSNLVLEDSIRGQTYLLLSYVETEMRGSGETPVLCGTYRAQRLSDSSYCEVKLNTIPNGCSVFRPEVETLLKIKHKHVVELIGEGQGVLKFLGISGRVEEKKVEYIALELLYDWNSYLNYITIPDSSVRKIFKKVVKTAAFISSKGVSLEGLAFERIKCTRQGIIKITGIGSPAARPFEDFLARPGFLSPVTAKVPGCPCQGQVLGFVLLKMRFGPQLGSFAKYSGEALGFRGNLFWAELEALSQETVSFGLRSLLETILASPSNAFSFADILAHPWLSHNEAQDDGMDYDETIDNI